MKAIVVNEQSSEKPLSLADVPEPLCDAGSVIVKVHAAGVNRADLMQRAGKYPPPEGASSILGLEVAGVIEAIGSDVSEWREGDKVCALLSGGGYAEKVSVPATHLMPLPDGGSLVQAAAIPEAFITAYTNLFVEGELRKGEVVLIHGGASGVGTAAIQLARRMGARVVCTVGTPEKAARCKALGADVTIVYRTEDFVSRLREWHSGGADVILDSIGKDYLGRNLEALARCGRLVQIATMSGAKAEVDLALLMRKRARIIGSVLRSRSHAEKAELIKGFREKFFKDLDAGVVRPVIDSVFALHDADKAHSLMQSSAHIGKIVLEV